MALPETRNTSYGATDPVLSNDLNSLEDCVISKKHGEVEVGLLPLGGVRTTINVDSTYGYIESAAVASRVDEHPLPLEEGDVITGLTANCYGTGAGTIAIYLHISKNDGTAADIYSLLVASAPASWARYTTATGLPRALLQGESAWLNITISNASNRVGRVGIIKKRL